jgi:ribosomal protein S18 acetylase RimI-like enzyme
MNGIRLFLLDDYEKVYALWEQTDGIGMRNLDDSREGIAKFMQRNPSTCFVYENDGEIVGAIMGGHDGRRGYIYHAVVRTDFRGQGIGIALLNAVCSALEDQGIYRAALVAKRTNESGAAFWKKQGWEERDDLIYFNKSFNELNT